MINWVKVGGLCNRSINTLDELIGTIDVHGSRCGLLLTTNPYVEWDGSQKIIARVRAQHGTESVLKVVSTTSLQPDSINVKPSTPEETAEPINMPSKHTSSIVSKAQINNGLDIEIYNAN